MTFASKVIQITTLTLSQEKSLEEPRVVKMTVRTRAAIPAKHPTAKSAATEIFVLSGICNLHNAATGKRASEKSAKAATAIEDKLVCDQILDSLQLTTLRNTNIVNDSCIPASILSNRFPGSGSGYALDEVDQRACD